MSTLLAWQMFRALRSLILVVFVIGIASAPSAQQPVDQTAPAVRETPVLKATDHPRFPDDPSKLWMVPKGSRRSTSEFADAVKL